MKRAVCGMLGAALVTLLMNAGCAQIASDRVFWNRTFHKAVFQDTNSSQSPADRLHSVKQVVDQDARAIVDDMDFILLRERPSRLSRWHNR